MLNWDKEEEDYLRFAFNTQSYGQIAKKLGRSRDSVEKKAYRMGLSKGPASPRRKWDEAEINYLRKAFNSRSENEIAKTLKRSRRSVYSAAKRYVEDHDKIAGLSMKDVAAAFSIDMSAVKIWYNKYGMPAAKRKFGKQFRFEIDGEKFWEWAKTHRDIITIARYERYSILPEPDDLYFLKWKEEPVNHRKKFTNSEKAFIAYLRGKGYTSKAIAERTGRTYESIKHVVRDLCKEETA